MTAKSNSNPWKSAAKVLVGLGLLLGLTAFVDYERLVASIVKADRKLLWLAFLTFSAQGIFESGRLKIVYAEFDIGFLESVRLFFVGIFFGNFMPGPIGADVYQVYKMHTIQPGFLRPLSLSVFLRLNGLFVNLILATAALFFGTKKWVGAISVHPINLTLPVWINLFILLVTILLAVILSYLWWGSHLHVLGEKISAIFRCFFDLFKSFTVKHHVVILVLGVLVVLSRAVCFFALVQAFGSYIGLTDVIFVVTVSALASLLPISIGGLGVREISLAALFIAFGVAPSEAVAISLVSRCFIWFLSLIGGAWFVMDKTHSNASI